MEATGADQVGTEGIAHAVLELGEVDDVGNGVRFEAEFAKHIDQVAGRDDEPVGMAQDGAGDCGMLKVIAGLSAAVIDEGLLPAKTRDEPCGSRREKERRVRSGKDVGDVDIAQTAPEVDEVDGLADESAKPGDTLDPSEKFWRRGIDGKKMGREIGIIVPLTHQQIRLNGLASDIAE